MRLEHVILIGPGCTCCVFKLGLIPFCGWVHALTVFSSAVEHPKSTETATLRPGRYCAAERGMAYKGPFSAVRLKKAAVPERLQFQHVNVSRAGKFCSPAGNVPPLIAPVRFKAATCPFEHSTPNQDVRLRQTSPLHDRSSLGSWIDFPRDS